MNIEPRDLLSLIAALSGLAAVVISLLAFFRANPQATPAQLDERAAASLEDLQKNRAAMEAYEVALQKQSENFKMAFDTLTMFARMLAGMVPSKTMQEAADTLADIKTPGAPATQGSKAWEINGTTPTSGTYSASTTVTSWNNNEPPADNPLAVG